MKNFKTLLSVLLSAVLVFFCAAVPADIGAARVTEKSSLNFDIISDIHYYPAEYTGNYCDEWEEQVAQTAKEFDQIPGILDAALDSIAARKDADGIEYLFIPGDLTKDSEYLSHVRLAERLERFEAETGIPVIVTCGNHDINTLDAYEYTTGKAAPARAIRPEEFPQVYANLGYDLAYATYTPPEGEISGMLSYAVDLGDDYRLIVPDSCKYSADEPLHQITGGAISDDLMDWILEQAREGQRQGRTVMLMQHHSIAPHMKCEPSVTFAFCVDDYLDVAEQYADAGIKYAFTGHLHTADISSVTSDSGNVIYDCETPALSGFPNYVRKNTITTYSNGESAMNYELFDCDEAHPVYLRGEAYAQPFRNSASFAICFGGANLRSPDGKPSALYMADGLVRNYLGKLLTDINSAGGLLEYLKQKDIDLAAIIAGFLEPYIGDGITIGKATLFSADNIMWFIEDLFDQIQAVYLDDPEAAYQLAFSLVERIVNIKVSDVPCTKFIDTLGLGDASRGGNFGEAALSTVYYWYMGNEDRSDDAFLEDVLKQFKEGDLAERLVSELFDIVYNDLLTDAVLARLNINIGKLFDPNSRIGKRMGMTADCFVNNILGGDTTYKSLVDYVFSLGVLPYTSLWDVFDTLVLKEYMTDSQYRQIGYEFWYFLDDFSGDANPQFKGDFDVSYSTQKVRVTPTREEYRLPSLVSVTMGDADDKANISWFTKTSVTGTDIEIIQGGEADFTGTASVPAGVSVDASNETVDRTYPGVDIGIFGILNYTLHLNRHKVLISGLEPGQTYLYRVGDAARNWWSDTGSIKTDDNDGKVTFFHMSDPQSGSRAQYEEAWAKVTKEAFRLYPGADFIMNTGDHVDHGANQNQWQWMFDTASDELLDTFMMPTSGNHEGKGDNAILNNFILDGLAPDQDGTTGVYYSFDRDNVHVTVLNTNDLNDDDELSEAQIAWLKNDISSSDAQWKIVAMHKGVYTNGSHYDDSDVKAMRKQLQKLLPDLGVDLVLEGHDHVYMRSYPLYNNRVSSVKRVELTYNGQKYIADVQPRGLTYVIDGTSGVKTYNPKDDNEIARLIPVPEAKDVSDSQMFSSVQIEDGVLYFDAYKMVDGQAERVDSFAIQKDTSCGEVTGDAKDLCAVEHIGNSFFLRLSRVFKIIFNVLKALFKVTASAVTPA